MNEIISHTTYIQCLKYDTSSSRLTHMTKARYRQIQAKNSSEFHQMLV